MWWWPYADKQNLPINRNDSLHCHRETDDDGRKMNAAMDCATIWPNRITTTNWWYTKNKQAITVVVAVPNGGFTYHNKNCWINNHKIRMPDESAVAGNHCHLWFDPHGCWVDDVAVVWSVPFWWWNSWRLLLWWWRWSSRRPPCRRPVCP